ncbi:MAG: uroporphyrinogen decarboxylase family protein [Planctomycetota bacterium]
MTSGPNDGKTRDREARDFLARLWRLENEERPGFVIGDLGPGGNGVTSSLFSKGRSGESLRERLLDPDRYLAAQMAEIAEQAAVAGDYVPALCPSLGVVAIPSAFGCPIVWSDDAFPAARPIVGDDPERVFDLPRPRVTDGLLGRILDYTAYFRARTGLPVRVTDIQGPLDSAALVHGHTEFLLAMRTAPAAVEHLLGLVTDLTIDFVRAQREAAGEFVPSLFQPWMPDGLGLSLSNDDGVMISAACHDRFAVPFVNRISRAFGGVYLHSCGNWEHLLPSLEKIENLRGLEFGAGETSFPAVEARFGGRLVRSTRVGLNRDIHFRSIADYVRSILAQKRTNRGLFIQVDITNGIPGDDWVGTTLDEVYALVGG